MTATAVAAMLWRRLDLPGHDACWLERAAAGWHLRGMAVFRHPAGPAGLSYAVNCDEGWRTMSGLVRGHVGGRAVEARMLRLEDGWRLNDAPVAGLGHLVDLDLGFTPATNLLQLRRVPMVPGEAVALPAAWFDLDAGSLSELRQSYRRRDAAGLLYDYEAPDVGYRGVLETTAEGFVRHYPGLWQAEPAS